MRRPNRSIEVFDISLMAVVTKAMGAFLVLMVVFMQYYSSGPLGQKTAADIAESIADTQKDLTEAMKKLVEKANPDEIAKLLEEARRRLEEASKLIEQMRRENDALNSQVQRLEDEKAQLEKQIEDMQRQIDGQKVIVGGTLINWDCLDVRLQLGVITPEMFLKAEKDQKIVYLLNYSASLGDSDANDDLDIKKTDPKAASAPPGESIRFNNSTFRYAAEPGVYTIIVVKERMQTQTIKGYSGRQLQRSKQDCQILLSINTAAPSKKQLITSFTRAIGLSKDDYATALYDIKIDGAGTYTTAETSQAAKNWLADQIAHAEKVP